MGFKPRYSGFLLCLVALPLSHCNNSLTGTRVVPEPTRMVVRPIDFLGDTYCGQEANALSSYQATLYDVSQSEDLPFALPSSKVVSCRSAVTFEAVEPGRRYVAVISAFESANLETQTPGSAIVVDSNGLSVSPRWRSICLGEDGVDYELNSRNLLEEWGLEPVDSFLENGLGGAGGKNGAAPAIGATSYFNTAINVAGCQPLLDSGTLGPTGVSVSLAQSLAGQACGSEGDFIEEYQITLEDEANIREEETEQNSSAGSSGTSLLEGLACDETSEIIGLKPGLEVQLEVVAFSADGLSRFITECRAFTREGTIVPASCDPLQLDSDF